MNRRMLALIGLLIFLGSSGNLGASFDPSEVDPEQRTEQPSTSTVISLLPQAYLPLVLNSDRFGTVQAIWPHIHQPASHEVALFRHTFTLPSSARQTILSIFADTRYEVWVDGVWLGRGPARFSQTYHEYDTYQIGPLAAGDHLIAVLVQWAPNTRRAESTLPYLKAGVQATGEQGELLLTAQTDSKWRALLSDAWREDAVPVHAWQLIGPTELLDLRRLPSNWMLPGYADSSWPAAMVKNEGNISYTPRSIPPLENVTHTVTMIDAGLLSPTRQIGEVTSGTTSLSFNVNTPLEFTLEMLAESDTPPTSTVRLDGSPLSWQLVSSNRPDVLVGSRTLAPGPHSLSFLNIPATGATFALPTPGVQYAALPFYWGPHAGRRALLSEPVSQPDIVITTINSETVELSFTQYPAYVVLDVGRVVHGRLVADISGPSGAVVDIGWDERLWMGKRPLPYPGSLHPQWNQVDSWRLDGTSRSISTLDARAGRYIWITIWQGAPVQIKNLHILEERYPVSQQGTFNSADPLLNQAWQIGVDTLRPNMTDAYTDTPWRERGQWWGDAYVEFQINRVAFGDTTLLRRGLILMAEAFENGEPKALAPHGEGVMLLDYGMLWVQALQDYWQLTGDQATVLQVYTPLQELLIFLQGYEHPDTGLLDIPVGHWSRTALIDWQGDHSRYGQSAALNALYYRTLLNAATLAKAVGDESQAEVYHQRANRVKEQLNEHLYLESQQQYASSWVGKTLVPPSPHAQAWPLACGIVPEDKKETVTSSLLTLLSPNPAQPNLEIYGMYWVLQALGETGHIPQGLSLIRNYYGRLIELGATTWWEGFNSHLQYTASLSHGWGGAPTWFLTTYVLGAQQTGPHHWVVQPALAGLEFVSGTLPFGKEPLAVTWKRSTCEHTNLEVIAPSDSQGEIILPGIGPTTVITLNQTLIWENGIPRVDFVFQDSKGIHIEQLSGGIYQVEIQQQCYSVYLPVILNRRSDFGK